MGWLSGGGGGVYISGGEVTWVCEWIICYVRRREGERKERGGEDREREKEKNKKKVT